MSGTPAPKRFGELALRCNDLDKMSAFYRDIVGLSIYSQDIPGIVFFEIAEADDGHPQLFALFDRSVEVGQETTTLDHFAFLIDLADYESEHSRLEALAVGVFLKEFPQFHWRSIFFYDPEGNTVELVTYDAEVR